MKVLQASHNLLVLLGSIGSLSIAGSCLLANSVNAQISEEKLQRSIPARIVVPATVQTTPVTESPKKRELNELVGTWKNTSNTTQGITTFTITKSKSKDGYDIYLIEILGRCHPNGCPQRNLKNIEYSKTKNRLTAFVRYEDSSANTELSIIKSGQNLTIQNYTRREDKGNYVIKDSFYKEEVAKIPKPETKPPSVYSSVVKAKIQPQLQTQYSTFGSNRTSRMDITGCINEAKKTMEKMEIQNINSSSNFVRGKKNTNDRVSIHCRTSHSTPGHCGAKGTFIQFSVRSDRNNGSQLYDELMRTFREVQAGCL
jgi:hypothetical protein